MDLYRFAALLDRGGGILEALDGGVGPQDAPEGELRDLWTRALDAYHAHLEPVVEAISDYLDTHVPGPGEDGYGDYTAIRDAGDPFFAPAPRVLTARCTYTRRGTR